MEIFGEFLEPIWTVHDCVGAVWGVCSIIYIINYVLVYRPLEMKLNCSSKLIWVLFDPYC